MLAGSILGAKRGALAVLVYLALAAAGLPVLPGGRGGLGAMLGPSGGFLLGFPFAAFAIGWLTERVLPRYTVLTGLIATLAGGVVLLYLFGIPWQAWRLGTSGLVSTAIASVVYLPGDVVKAVLATLIAKGVHHGYPTLARDLTREKSRRDANTDCN